MRKLSQDGGDTTSATCGVENETRKPKSCLLEFKAKKIGKRTAPNLSEESDDAVIEPLLQKTTDKTVQSAKYFAKAKADTVKEISKLFNDKKSQYASTSGFGTTETLLSEKDQDTSKSNLNSNTTIHNYMNTNIFHSHDDPKVNVTTKSQLLVEIDGNKQSGYNPSPLIFTTAKIHTDGKSKNMEPVQMSPGPISSTVEVSVSKSGTITTNEKKVSNGTSVMNTVFPQPHVTEKAKEDNAFFSNSNKTPVTQSKDHIITDKNSNPTKPCTTEAISPTDTHSKINEKAKESTANILKSNITTAAISKDVTSKTANPSKILSPLSNKPVDISSSPETPKSTKVDVKNKQGATKDTKDTKKLVDEPRILMSESKLKSTISGNTKTISSVTKSPLELTKTFESSAKQPQTSQPNKSGKQIQNKEKDNSRSAPDTTIKTIDIKDTQPLQNKNIKSPTVTKELAGKSNATSTKPLQQQNKTPTEISAQAFKTESSSSKTTESSNVPSAKTSSSMKTPTQPKVIDSKLSKEIDKSQKPSANEITKPNSKVSLNNTATSSTKTPTSASSVKPASNVSSSNVTSSSITDTSSKTMNKSLSNSKPITSTVATTATATIQPSVLKTQSSSTTNTATSTSNTKPTVSSTKSAKPASSIKSPQVVSTPTSAKVPNTSTAKTGTGKAPPLAFTKTPPVSISSPTAAPASKPSVSKTAQVSTINPAGQSSSSKASVDTSIKTKTSSDLHKKAGSKPDPTKDTKVSKA